MYVIEVPIAGTAGKASVLGDAWKPGDNAHQAALQVEEPGHKENDPEALLIFSR